MEAARPTGTRQLNIAMGYGGQQEIVDATRELMSDLLRAGITPEEIPSKVTRDSLAAHMYLSDLPDAELIIRTSGESRLSGFLLWQSAYAEFSFVDVHWPAFRRVDFLRSLRDFAQRDRRFGQ
jgi:short-chain Z-isoprenyl diphosphate synthase